MLLSWWDAICLYSDAVGAMMLTEEDYKRLEEERARLRVSVECEEDERIERFRQAGQDADFGLVSEVFAILAKREFDMIHR